MNTKSRETRSSDLQQSGEKLKTEMNQLTPLSVNLARHLFELSKNVVKDDVNPKTVAAACNCAGQIHKLLSLAYKYRR